MRHIGQYLSLTVLSLTLLLVACQDTLESDSERSLSEAKVSASSKPEKALRLLNGIIDPHEFSEEKYMQYVVLRIQAKHKLYQDIGGETEVLEAYNYFLKKKDSYWTALAALYSANLFIYNNLFDEALDYLLEAEKYIGRTEDVYTDRLILYNIGYVYFMQDMLEQSLSYFNYLMDLYGGNNQDRLQLQTYEGLGLGYYEVKNDDESMRFVRRGLALAEKMNDMEYQSKFNRNIGFVYRAKKEYGKSLEYIFKSLEQAKTDLDVFYSYLNLVKLYNLLHRPDLAEHYTEKLKEWIDDVEDIYTLRNLYSTLVSYYEQVGDYKQALFYDKAKSNVIEQIEVQYNKAKLAEAERRISLADQRQKLKAENKKVFYNIASTTSVFLILIIICLVFFKRQSKRTDEAMSGELERVLLLSELLKEKSKNKINTQANVE